MKKILKFALFLSGFLLNSCGLLNHIEDTNGSDDFTIQTITDDQIINNNSYLFNSKLENNLFGLVDISASKFSGVHYIKDLSIGKHKIISNVLSGNFRICLINNKQIVNDIPVNQAVVKDISTGCSLKIAGESAQFSLKVSEN